ncbi:3-hydroxyisobutyryl-CoA hydrolase, mitochondrial-like isoform X1 [Panonychus citri]|uniref:3-hydroxyisobutyryl-CoA hydrolase, mitochondrial-like isoform X1 n=2 Tax=Panonychus citri TaxID=50023 RepID=UPI002307C99B|nr:3-hydroxyisobutyryl-CoA hydrolase, mitochondrial-like isoform X1 [Panonychus citri]
MSNICMKRLLFTRRNDSVNLIYQLSRQRMSSASSASSSSSSDDDVILNREDNKGIIICNRPNQLNALNLSMVRKIYPQLRKWEMDNSMKMVIIKGTGDKAFCAGGDIKVVAQSGNGSPLGLEFFREEYRLNNQIGSMAIPYVALLNGIVMGGGVGLSVHGAYRVATEKAVFAMPETAIGFFPDVGGSHFLPRLPGKLGIYLALTGARLHGRDLFKAGIATHFVCSDRLEELESDLLRMKVPDLKGIDSLLTRYQEQWEADYKKEFSLKQYKGRINSAFGAESVEQIMENLSKDSSDWSKQQLEILNSVSPTSLKVTFKALQQGAMMSLPDCLKMEYRIAHKMMHESDFFEGVRAALIDKDKSPKWKPSKLEDVTEDQVNAYFNPSDPQFKELQL